MPLTLGGLGLGNAQRTRDAAHWGSWADSLEMIGARHPELARRVVMVRDLDIAQGNSDLRRLEVIAEGLSLFGEVQLALDATLVSRTMEMERRCGKQTQASSEAHSEAEEP